MLSSVEPSDPNGPADLDRAKTIAMVGVILQLVAFGLFSVVAVRFHFTSKRFADDFKHRLYPGVPGDGKYVTLEGGAGASAQKYNPVWRRLLYAVNISCLMILVSFPFVPTFSSGCGLIGRCHIDSICLPSDRLRRGKDWLYPETRVVVSF